MQYKSYLKSLYWDSLAERYSKNPDLYRAQARKALKKAIRDLRAEAVILEEILQELK